jgi:ribosomal protein S18 acetylase RimI-like enzyme
MRSRDDRTDIVVSQSSLNPAAFFQLYAEAFENGQLTIYAFRQYKDLFPSLFLVAHHDKTPIGYIVGGVGEDRTGWILSIGVVQRFRKESVAATMLNELLQRFVKMNVMSVSLTVSENNQAAIQLFERSGFFIQGPPTDYYADGGTKLVGVLSLDGR